MRSGEYVDPRSGGIVRRTPAVIVGIASDERIRQALERVSESLAGLQEARGYEYLLRTSRNYKAAKSLALRSPEWVPISGGESVPEDLQAVIAPVIQAYLGGTAAIKGFEDADRLQAVVTNPWHSQVGESKVCAYWGSDHLAFVRTTSTYEAVGTLGWRTVLLILRKPENKWKFLAGCADTDSNNGFAKEIPKIVSRVEKPWTPRSQPLPAKLLAPEDGKNLMTVSGERDFTWQPSASSDVVEEVAEFVSDEDVRFFVRFLRVGHHARSESISAGKLPTTHGEWRWRVWSISDSGAVAFSDSRSFVK
jgi:hypothetical protein